MTIKAIVEINSGRRPSLSISGTQMTVGGIFIIPVNKIAYWI